MRKGSKKAVVAIAHKVIIAVYHVLNKKEKYKSPELENTKYNERQKQKEVQKSISKLSKLGFTVRITPGRIK